MSSFGLLELSDIYQTVWDGHFRPVFLLQVQLNKYETAPNFIQVSQNLTLDCLLILLNFPVFTKLLHDLIIKLFCFDLQNHFMIRSCKNCVKTGKFSQINKQSNVKFWLIWLKFGAVSYLLSCTYNVLHVFTQLLFWAR